MGCVSSKLFAKEKRQENLCRGHVVSLTSTTYGLLKLDKDRDHQTQAQEEKEAEVKPSVLECVIESKKSSPKREEPSEIINAWELMEGLEEEVADTNTLQTKKMKSKSPKSRFLLDPRSPLKFFKTMDSPRKVKEAWGKENKSGVRSLENTPKTVLKERNAMTECARKPSPRLWASIKGSPHSKRCDSSRIESGPALSRGRKSLGPLFDPELVASFEKEVDEAKEEIKKMVSASANPPKVGPFENSEAILELYSKNCPSGGENAVILYTTTLRGIRKTFEECNVARKIIESQSIRMYERDISIHSGYKEELRKLMGSREVRVPLVFVKGRLIGGADEMAKLDEEGKLGMLFDGIPKANGWCEACGGIRFVMCAACNGSCKLLGEDGRKSVKCNSCNENGLILCPKCS